MSSTPFLTCCTSSCLGFGESRFKCPAQAGEYESYHSEITGLTRHFRPSIPVWPCGISEERVKPFACRFRGAWKLKDFGFAEFRSCHTEQQNPEPFLTYSNTLLFCFTPCTDVEGPYASPAKVTERLCPREPRRFSV